MTTYVLLLGTNLGNRDYNLSRAISLLSSGTGKILRLSDVIETAPIGEGVTGLFLNQAVIVSSSFSPLEMLSAVEDIERLMGRAKSYDPNWKNASSRVFENRIIDIDIALVDLNGEMNFLSTWNSDRLQIPHHSVYSRPFVKSLLDSLSISYSI